MNTPKKPFFIGYLKPPRQLLAFLIICSAGLIIGFASASYLTGTVQNDPGNGQLRFDLKRQTLTGFFELLPYPLFHVTKGNAHIPVGHTLMLTRGGKRGLHRGDKKLAGKLVTLNGILIERGDLDMLQVRQQIKPINTSADDIPEVTIENLGRWKLAGEICDGKCLAGAMRPGRGLAHKACANLCLVGGIPPVFVSNEKILNEEYFLIAGPNNTPLPESSNDYIGQYISLEGDLERRGNLVVLRMDPESVKKTMILRKLIGLSVIALVSLVFFYLSRFWIFEWWSRKGLFEIKSIRPNGGLLDRWLAGTPFQPFELLIWAGGVFLLLTLLQKLFQKFDS